MYKAGNIDTSTGVYTGLYTLVSGHKHSYMSIPLTSVCTHIHAKKSKLIEYLRDLNKKEIKRV